MPLAKNIARTSNLSEVITIYLSDNFLKKTRVLTIRTTETIGLKTFDIQKYVNVVHLPSTGNYRRYIE